MKKLSIFILSILLSSCFKSKISESVEPSLDSTKVLVKSDEKKCVTPWGEVLQSGDRRLAYRQSKTDHCRASCDTLSEYIVCTDGVLSNADEYIYNNCERPKCDCNIDFLNRPMLLRHGDYLKLYTKSISECEPCEKFEVQRQCVDGVLTGDETATLQSCSLKKCQDCPLSATETLAHGQTKDFYKTDKGVSCDPSLKCESQNVKQPRTCWNGVLSGNSNYNMMTCADKPCSCKIENSTFPHGGNVTYYKSKQAQCRDSFLCEDASNKITSTCTDGVVAGLGLGQGFEGCIQEKCSCKFVDQSGTIFDIPDGKSIPVYSNAQPSCGNSCSAVKGEVQCVKGVLKGNVDYKAKSCVESTCDCQFKDTKGQSVTVKDGESTSVYAEESPQCGISCKSGTVTCKKTVLSGDISFKAKSCVAQTCDCSFTDIDGVKSIVTNKNSQPVYAAKKVSCGNTCASATVSCNNTLLTGNLNYKATSCSVETCICKTPWGTNVTASESKSTPIIFYKQEASICGQAKCNQIPNLFTEYYCIKGATGRTYWVDKNDKEVTQFPEYKFAACSDPICNCSAFGKTIPQGEVRNFYKKESVACGQMCESNENYVGVACGADMSVSAIPKSTNLDLFFKEKTYNSCKVGDCPPGAVADAPAVSDGTGDGEAGDGGGKGGGTGDGEGPGIGFKGRKSGSGGGGDSIGGNTILVHTLDRLRFQPGCELPWGGVVTHGASVVAFKLENTPSGQKCSQYKVIRTCLNSVLNGDTNAKYLSCTER